MTPDRGPITRCRVRGCAYLGHFSGYDDLCPSHRDGLHDARPPELHEQWDTDDTGRR